MSRIEPTRCYLRNDDGSFSRFLWFHNHKPNEMLIGLSGLTSKRASLDYMIPDRVVSRDELQALHASYSDAIEVKKPTEHITCHSSGSFHIKTIDGNDLYVHKLQREEPLGANTSIFLDFIILSDLGKNYSCRTKSVKMPAVCFDVQPMDCIAIRGMFSGANYNLEKVMVGTVSKVTNQRAVFKRMIRLAGNTLKGILWYETTTVTEEIPGRPSGTFVSFCFPTGEDSYLVKAFVFG